MIQIVVYAYCYKAGFSAFVLIHKLVYFAPEAFI